MVLAAQVSSSGAAFEQPLANIDYALPHYHALVRDAFAAGADGDEATALEAYGQAHEVMADTLLPEAEFLDKANSYVLDTTYDGQKARSVSTGRLIVVSWLALLGFLALAQILLDRRFRRVLNLGLVLATVIALVSGGVTLRRLDASSAHLADAREQAFQSVHVLARAPRWSWPGRRRASSSSIRAPPRCSARLRPPGEPVAPDGGRGRGRPGRRRQDPRGRGWLSGRGGGTRRRRHRSRERPQRGARLRGLPDRGHDDAEAREHGRAWRRRWTNTNGQAYTDLDAAITAAQAIEQGTFDESADAAEDAAAPLDVLNLLAAAGILLLAQLGLFQRLREYRA